MGPVLQAIFIALVAFFFPVAAHSVPVNFRIDFHVDEIGGCSGYPCGFARGPDFLGTFTIDSGDLASSSVVMHKVRLASPLYLSDAGGYIAVRLGLTDLVLIGRGMDLRLNMAVANPIVPNQCFEYVFGACIARGEMSFAETGEDTFRASWSWRDPDGSSNGFNAGTYEISVIGQTPLPAGLPLFASVLGFGAVVAWRRRCRIDHRREAH